MKYILFLAIILNSCDSFLEIKPSDKIVSTEALTSLDDCNAILAGVYFNYNFATNIAVGEIAADNLKTNKSSGSSYLDLHNWSYTPSYDWPAEYIWKNSYSQVYMINNILNNVDQFKDTRDNINFYKKIKGEALCFRAYIYYNLLILFSDRYNQNSENTDLAIPYLTIDSKTATYPSRNTVKETIDFINKDLDSAIVLLSYQRDNFSTSNTIHFNYFVANAMKARLALNCMQWQKAIDYAEKTITESGLKISSITNYKNIWDNTTTEEILLKIKVTQSTDDDDYDETYNVAKYFHHGYENEAKYFFVSNDYIDLFKNNDTNDIRLKTDITEIPSDGNKCFYEKKYNLKSNIDDTKLFRIAEMYFIKAEAYYYIDQVKSLETLNYIRQNRINKFINGTEIGDQLLKEIYKERRKEFAFEGFRFFDLKRWNQDIQRYDLGTNALLGINKDSYKFTFPIPSKEIYLNKNLIQNKKY